MSKKILIFCAVITTLGSAYSTYLGLDVSIGSHHSAIIFSSVSAIAAFGLSLFVTKIRQSEDIALIKKLTSVVLVLVVTFFGSTLWSVVGIASEDIFREYKKKVVLDVETSISQDHTLACAEEAANTVSTLLSLVTKINENALSGKYTGSKKEGPLSRTFELLKSDISIQNKALEGKVEQMTEIIEGVGDNLVSMKEVKDLKNRGDLNTEVSKVNTAMLRLDNIIFKPILETISAQVNFAITMISDFEKKMNYNSVSSALIKSQMNSLTVQSTRLAENIEKINEVKLLDTELLDKSITWLALDNYFSIIHWWMFCITIDLLPILALSVALREE